MLGLRAVGQGLRRVDVHDAPFAQRALAVVAGLGLDAEHLAARRQRPRRQRAARQQAAAAERDEQRVQRAGVFQQFQRRRALAGDHVRVVVGRDQRHAALGGELAADLLAVFGVALVQAHLGAVTARGGQLGGRRVVRHHDGGRHAQQASRQRHRLRVVAGRERHHAGTALGGVELRQRVEGPAELEGAHALQVLALEEELRAGGLVGRAGGQHRRAVRVALQARGGGTHVVESGQVGRRHGALL